MKKHLLLAALSSLALAGIALSCSSDMEADANRGADSPDWDGGSDGDMDMDMDTDSDSDSDYDTDASGEDDGYPPELEEQANYMAPQGSGQYVFIADENHDAVVVVDSQTLAIKVVEVGSRPTHLVPLSDKEDGRVAVINLDSDDVTILQVNSLDDIKVIDLPIRPDTNALVPSSDGQYVIAFHDPAFTAESGAPRTDQEITVLSLKPGAERSVHMSVGMHPWQVTYNEKITRAFIVNEEGINIIDLENLDAAGIPPIVSPFEGGTYDSTTADIEITPDGWIAFARKTESNQLIAAALDGTGEMRTYVLPTVPTDLDIAKDGSFGVLVLRSLSQVALFELPLPADEQENPFSIIDLGGKVAGIATVSDDGNNIVLHTTTAGETEDKKRLTLLSRQADSWQVRSTVLERTVRAVATGTKSNVAVVMHQRVNPTAGQLPYSYSIITIPGLQSKFQQISVEPGQLLFTPDGEFGYLLLEQVNRTDIIDFKSFIVDTLQLGSPPTAAGFAAATDKVFIAQDHPAGRMTFVGVHDGSVKTVTGYNLNDEIEY